MATAAARKKKIVEKVKARKSGGDPNRSRTGKYDLSIISRRQARTVELHRQSYTQMEIVAKMREEGIATSQGQVSKDIQEMLVQLTEHQVTETEKLRAMQLDRIAMVRRTAWEEFQFSQQRRIKIRPPKGSPEEEKVIVERCEGNIEWVSLIKDLEDLEAKISGTVRPNTTQQNNVVVNNFDWSSMSSPPGDMDVIEAKIESVRLLKEKDDGTGDRAAGT